MTQGLVDNTLHTLANFCLYRLIRMKWTHTQKIAERLTILNKRAPGMLTRLYNLKKQLADPKTRPAFMAKPLV